jgi:hypothetical protein
VNTASAITRGFINVTKSGNRAAKLGREIKCGRNKGNPAVFIVDPQAEVFVSQRVLRLFHCYAADIESVSKCRQIPANFS